MPIAFAVASCWMRFILAKSADVPICLLISLATVAKSLVKAASLAFSKLRLFPVNNSASISADIDCSNWSKLPAILSTCSRLIPIPAAADAASVNFPGMPANLVNTPCDVLAMSSSTFLLFIAAPFCLLKLLTPCIIDSLFSLTDVPFNLDNWAKLAAALPAMPISSVIWATSKISSVENISVAFIFNSEVNAEAALM